MFKIIDVKSHLLDDTIFGELPSSKSDSGNMCAVVLDSSGRIAAYASVYLDAGSHYNEVKDSTVREDYISIFSNDDTYIKIAEPQERKVIIEMIAHWLTKIILKEALLTSPLQGDGDNTYFCYGCSATHEDSVSLAFNAIDRKELDGCIVKYTSYQFKG